MPQISPSCRLLWTELYVTVLIPAFVLLCSLFMWLHLFCCMSCLLPCLVFGCFPYVSLFPAPVCFVLWLVHLFRPVCMSWSKYTLRKVNFTTLLSLVLFFVCYLFFGLVFAMYLTTHLSMYSSVFVLFCLFFWIRLKLFCMCLCLPQFLW